MFSIGLVVAYNVFHWFLTQWEVQKRSLTTIAEGRRTLSGALIEIRQVHRREHQDRDATGLAAPAVKEWRRYARRALWGARADCLSGYAWWALE
jgi:hypothetical protein